MKKNVRISVPMLRISTVRPLEVHPPLRGSTPRDHLRYSGTPSDYYLTLADWTVTGRLAFASQRVSQMAPLGPFVGAPSGKAGWGGCLSVLRQRTAPLSVGLQGTPVPHGRVSRERPYSSQRCRSATRAPPGIRTRALSRPMRERANH